MDDRGRTIAWVIRDISRLYTMVGQKSLAPWGITMAHWYYLRVLEPGSLNQLELSKRVGIASTTAVPALDFLEKQELVVRTRDPQDRRKYNVSLTNKGKALINEVMEVFDRVLQESLKGTSQKEMEIVWKNLLLLESNLLASADNTELPQSL